MTEQQYPDIKPGLRVQYRAESMYMTTLAGEVREVNIIEDGMVAVIDPANPRHGVTNEEAEATFWEMYEPERPVPPSELPEPQVPVSLPTREQVYEAAQDAAGNALNWRERRILDAVLALFQNGADR